MPFYSGTLDLEERIDSINSMNKHFDYVEVKEDMQVRFSITRLRGHASLCCDGVQEERILKNKARINSSNRMTAKLRGKFLPKDYRLILFRKMKNIKQKSMTVREYAKEFYKVNIRSGHMEDTPERVARHIIGLRFDIQDELGFLSLISIEDAYQVYLRVEEKLMRKQSQKEKGFEEGNNNRKVKPAVQIRKYRLTKLMITEVEEMLQ